MEADEIWNGKSNIRLVRTLLPKQQASLERLVQLCREQDGITLSCPVDGDLYWIIYDEPENASSTHFRYAEQTDMAACLAAYDMGDNAWECCGFTRPDLRGQGYFSVLLENACGENGMLADADLYFLTDGRCAGALAVLEHIGAEHGYDELMMEVELDAAQAETGPAQAAPPLTANTSASVLSVSLSSNLTAASLFSGSSLIGSCKLQPGKSGIYLYDLEIIPGKRRQGLGTRFLQLLFPLLYSKGFSRLTLQVSGENRAALALYKKTGFRITKTLSYYLY